MPPYPFAPKTNAQLRPGQFWSIPMSDGRFACGRVLSADRPAGRAGARSLFLAGILDWVGDDPPTAESIAGRPLLAAGHANVRVVTAEGGPGILGERPLALDGIVPPTDVNSWWGVRFPVLRAERRFIAGDPPPAFERRPVASPLTGEMLRPSPSGRGIVQFNALLTDTDFGLLAEWLRQYPEMGLRAYGSYRGSIKDLEFLRHFPTLRSFWVDAIHDLESIDGLRHLPPDVVDVGIGATSRRLDLSVLARFGDLTSLSLEGQTRHLEVLSGLTKLEDLTLRSITMPDLSLLLPLRRLRSFDLKLGGTSDLGLLPRVGELRYVELWLIRGLTDISVVGRIPTLRSLFLQALKRVEQLPDFAEAVALRRLHLETMAGLRDLRPLRTAPALEELILIDMRQLAVDDLRPLAGMPSLRAVFAGLGSIRKNDAATAMLGLPPVDGPFDWRAPI